MHKTVVNLIDIKKEINSKKLDSPEVKIIAVCKTFSMENIIPLIDYGHLDFGENKVQEAIEKWSVVKEKYQNLNLHMVGRLQTNKVKQAIRLFDYIHSLDSVKLAEKIYQEQKKYQKKIKLFIQINIGDELQKSGIYIKDFPKFYDLCIKDLNLDIVGLMCIPPANLDPSSYFERMKRISQEYSLNQLSMGMSSDYLTAIKFNATFVRIGSKIFGERS